MKRSVLVILLICGVAFTIISFFGDESYAKLQSLRKSLEAQKAVNADLKDHVRSLDSQIRNIQLNDRELEKKARNELGMARANELIFVFEKEPSTEDGKTERELQAVSPQKR